MNLPTFDKRGFSDAYLGARAKVDDLCRRIVGSGITTEVAMRSFEQIESEYADEEPEYIELFRMIYRSRIVRLVNQISCRD